MPAAARPATSAVAGDEEARRAILEQADRLLATGDEAAFSIRRLVARCGYPAPTIYRHFGDKQRLLAELLEVRLAELAAALRAVPEASDAVDRLRGRARVFADFGLEHPAYYLLFTRTEGPDAPRPPSAETCTQLLSEPLDRLAEEGRVVTRDLELSKNAFWALIHGVVSLQVTHPEREWDERLLDEALGGMIAGTIRPPRAAGRASAVSAPGAAQEDRS